MNRLALIALTLLTACKPAEPEPEPEMLPKGSTNPMTFKEYFNALKSTFGASTHTKLNWFDDIHNGLLITTTLVGGCDKYRDAMSPGAITEMPDGTYAMCREDGRVKWKMDRR